MSRCKVILQTSKYINRRHPQTKNLFCSYLKINLTVSAELDIKQFNFEKVTMARAATCVRLCQAEAIPTFDRDGFCFLG